jgi:sterol 3beta-glucosyltransferase
MKIGLQGWGSEGDLRPVVALAAALRQAGHEVRVDLTAVDGTDYRELGRRLQVPVRMLPERMDFALHEVARDADSANPMKVSRELLEQSFFPHLDLLYQAALELCGWAEVAVWHYSSWYTLAAARKLGKPSVALHLFPGMVPTRTAAPPGMPSLGPLNLPFWWLASRILDLQFRKRPAELFARVGLPPLRHVLPDLLFSEQLNLHAMSRLLVPQPPDWPAHHHVVGTLALGEAAQSWTPSEGLRAFLEEGSKPALFSLGSMEHLAPRRARCCLAAA